MKRIAILTFALLAIIVLSNSCSKTVDPVWMVYEEENCNPPWVGKNDRRSKDNLEAMLRNDGVIPLKIRIKGDRNNNCDVCWCKTGKTYHVQVDASQMSYLFYYGFVAE